MKAILWDGVKQISGELQFGDKSLEFVLYDFSHTDLHLSIAYDLIINIRHQQVFGLSDGGLEITSKNGKRSVFVVEDVEGVKGEIEGRKGGDCFVNLICQDIEVTSGCSIITYSNDLDERGVRIYPNPTNGLLTIESPRPIHTIQMVNTVGQVILTSGPKSNIDISNLKSGVYIVLLKIENQIIQRKILKI